MPRSKNVELHAQNSRKSVLSSFHLIVAEHERVKQELKALTEKEQSLAKHRSGLLDAAVSLGVSKEELDGKPAS